MNNMNDELLKWQAANEKYLSAALHWLRLRLTILARDGVIGPRPPASNSEPETKEAEVQQAVNQGAGLAVVTAGRPEKSKSVFSFLSAPVKAEPPPSSRQPSPELFEAGSLDELNQAEAAMHGAVEAGLPPALVILSERFGLSEFEQQVMLLCAGIELDTSIAELCGRAQGNLNRPYPTFSLAMTLFEHPAWDVMSPERPLRHWHLLEITQPAGQPLTTSPLRADERIVNYVKGLNYLDDRLEPLMAPFEAFATLVDLPASQVESADLMIHYLNQKTPFGSPPVIQLVGADPLSKQLVAQYVAQKLKLMLYRIPIELLPTQTAELELVSRLWERESILMTIALFLDVQEANPDQQKGIATPLERFLARSKGIFFLSTRELRQDLGAGLNSVEIDKPSPSEQREAWAQFMRADDVQGPAKLAGQFNFNFPTIMQIDQITRDQLGIDSPAEVDALWQTCRDSTRPRLDLLAQRIDVKATWQDIVLQEHAADKIDQIIKQVDRRSKVYDEWKFRDKMNRGLGITVLFSGVSGTGKTMAAEVIANELNLNLYRIDLSAVVSKYIGETEKNLRKLFDAAEDGGAILFFDEADALFGKRSQVKDSHDRYANIETNYLLQRMEAFQGLAILATNMKNALDQAFMRRLRFMIEFQSPNRQMRSQIWQNVFPAEAVQNSELDFDHLAKLNLTGGSISNVALNAAFLAADKIHIEMTDVLKAARTEMQKGGQQIDDRLFHWEPKVAEKTEAKSKEITKENADE